jgi:hypothetical protein
MFISSRSLQSPRLSYAISWASKSLQESRNSLQNPSFGVPQVVDPHVPRAYLALIRVVERLATIHEESADETDLKHVSLEGLWRYLDDNLLFLIFSPFCDRVSGSASEEKFLGAYHQYCGFFTLGFQSLRKCSCCLIRSSRRDDHRETKSCIDSLVKENFSLKFEFIRFSFGIR